MDLQVSCLSCPLYGTTHNTTSTLYLHIACGCSFNIAVLAPCQAIVSEDRNDGR
jgi:hypothetical protein